MLRSERMLMVCALQVGCENKQKADDRKSQSGKNRRNHKQDRKSHRENLNIAKPNKRQLNRVPVKARRHRPFAWQKRKLREQPDTL